MAYKKSQTPPKVGDDYIYVPTTADQVILSDGTRLEKGGKLPWNLERVAFSITLAADGWVGDGAPYTQTIVCDNVKIGDDLEADIDMSGAMPDTYATMNQGWNFIGRLYAGDGFITAYCYGAHIPQLDLKINIHGIREV